jgi:hypothetical protein
MYANLTKSYFCRLWISKYLLHVFNTERLAIFNPVVLVLLMKNLCL